MASKCSFTLCKLRFFGHFCLASAASPTLFNSLLRPLGINQDISRRDRLVTEGAQPHTGALLFQKQHPVERQPEFQRTAEQMAYQLHAPHQRQSLFAKIHADTRAG